MGGGRFTHGAAPARKELRPFRARDYDEVKVDVPQDVHPGDVFA